MFKDQVHAGELLAQKLAIFQRDHQTLVAAVPGRGVMTAYSLSKSLNLPLELIGKAGLLPTQRLYESIRSQTVILTDSGIQTGNTISIAIQMLKSYFPTRIIVAVPIASEKVVRQLKTTVDEVVCLKYIPEGCFLKDFYTEANSFSYRDLLQYLKNDTKESDHKLNYAS